MIMYSFEHVKKDSLSAFASYRILIIREYFRFGTRVTCFLGQRLCPTVHVHVCNVSTPWAGRAHTMGPWELSAASLGQGLSCWRCRPVNDCLVLMATS